MKFKRLFSLIMSVAIVLTMGVTLSACGASSAALMGISVECKTEYEEGNTFDTASVAVTAEYEDGTTKAVTGWQITIRGKELTADYKLLKTDNRITVSYTEGEVTKTKNVTITVVGDWALSITNATIDGKSQLALRRGAKLNPEAEVVLEAGVIGWQDEDGNFYESYAKLAETFVMPARDSQIIAVTSANFTKAFTPSCSYKKIKSYGVNSAGYETVSYDNSSQVNGAFEHVLIEEGVWGTRYVMKEKVDIGILNGSDEGHTNDGEHEGMSNECPFSDTIEKIIVMVFTNNSEESITFKYGVECFGIRGEVEVTLEPGETETAYLKQLFAPSGSSGSVAFHFLRLVEGGNTGYDLTIHGFLAEAKQSE